ncbi:MinD/ParA family protein [Microbacterium sp. M28]|uniref:MinD/ParA family ATP-binding protein n=1 Tax=Microbacterium sp. M28 TaxID=2962064 RepID=UPI0021F40107|nr:MinD/ParA family protein [Microbacterium sp. M28]UYO95941.1 MinD/ParA family protein [Microbacterium sp. M28]
MTAKNTDRPDDDDSLGVLDDAASLDTASLGILGGTAQVSLTIPTGDEDDLLDDDAVVDGEVASELIIDPAPELEPSSAADVIGRIKDGGIDIVIEVAADELPEAPAATSVDAPVTAEVVLDHEELADRIATHEAGTSADSGDLVIERDAEPATTAEPEPSVSPIDSEGTEDAAAESDDQGAAAPVEVPEPAPAAAAPQKAKPLTKPAKPAKTKPKRTPKPVTPVDTDASDDTDAPVDTDDRFDTDAPVASAPSTAAATSTESPASAASEVAAAPADAKVEEPATQSEPADAAPAPRPSSAWVATVERAAAGEASDPEEEQDDTVSTEKDARTTSTETSVAPRPVSAPVRADVELTSKRLGEQLGQASRESADLLTADRLLDPHQVTKPEPEGAWSHFLYTVSGRRINIGDGKNAKARKALSAKIAAPLSGGARFVPVLSRKGGVGKTTITALLGMALADARDDRVIAVDANPDRGTLAERIVRSHNRSVRDLVRLHGEVRGYHDISAIVARDSTRLDVLASDTDPRIADAFSDADYRDVADIAAHYYSLVLTDTGTGIVHSVMGATLELADQLVIVSGLSVDEARLASETLTWLETNGYAAQARDAIVVLNQSTPGSPLVRLNELEAHFATRARHVVRMPYDPQIAGGGAIVFTSLQPETRKAARELAALLVEGLRASAA